MVYAGHQFGQWAGQLGDGRGLLIAQILDKDNQTIDLHLKGAGKRLIHVWGWTCRVTFSDS